MMRLDLCDPAPEKEARNRNRSDLATMMANLNVRIRTLRPPEAARDLEGLELPSTSPRYNLDSHSSQLLQVVTSTYLHLLSSCIRLRKVGDLLGVDRWELDSRIGVKAVAAISKSPSMASVARALIIVEMPLKPSLTSTELTERPKMRLRRGQRSWSSPTLM